MSPKQDELIQLLYKQLMAGWNQRNAAAMADPFANEGELIGFDGSQIKGKPEILAHLQPIFADHITPIYYSKVREVLLLSEETAMLRAIAGMVPAGQTDIKPELNTHHTLIACKRAEKWQIVLFQNTPALFHLNPDLVEKMTAELRELL